MVLPAVLREDWHELVRVQATPVAARTKDSFRECQRNWMTSFTSEGSAKDLKEYIKTTTKKEREDSIYHLVSRAKTLRRCHFQLLARGAVAPPMANQRMTDCALIMLNFAQIQVKQQAPINYNLQQANAKRADHLYRIGDKVLQIQHGHKKMDERATGSYSFQLQGL